MKFLRSTFDTLMADVYPRCENIYRRVVRMYRELVTAPLPLCIISVHVHRDDGSLRDITRDYLTSNAWRSKVGSGDSVHVTWGYNTSVYRYAFKTSDPIEFPPYTIEQLRQPRPAVKIVAASVDGNNDLCDTIIEYAGPKHNFYIDRTTGPIDISWIVPGATKVDICDSTGQFHTLSNSKLVFNET